MDANNLLKGGLFRKRFSNINMENNAESLCRIDSKYAILENWIIRDFDECNEIVFKYRYVYTVQVSFSLNKGPYRSICRLVFLLVSL